MSWFRILWVGVFLVGSCSGDDWFLHRTTGSNTAFNVSILPRHLTNDGSLRVFTQPRTRPGKTAHANRNIGVYFTGSEWAHYFEDRVNSVPLGMEYSVFLPGAGDLVFTHTHQAASQSVFKRSYLNHASLNNKPNALIFLSHNYTAGGNTYNNQFSPVTYDTSANRWYIHGYIPGDEFTDIPGNATWNVHVVPSANEGSYRHTATNENTSGGITTLDHPLLNDNPNALLLVTNHWPQNFVGATFSIMTSQYDVASGRWTLQTLRPISIQEDSVFHLKISQGPETPAPGLSISYAAPTASISFPTEFGYTYQLQASPDLATFYNEGLPFAGTGFSRTYPTTVVLPQNNYRLLRTVGEIEE